jgi:hypothetical protein
MGVSTSRRQTPAQSRATAAKRKTQQTPADQRTVMLASGRGQSHAQHPRTTEPYPACRVSDKAEFRTSRYAHSAVPVSCEKCIDMEATNAAAKAARAALPGRATAAERTPTGDPYAGKAAPRARRARRNGPAQDEAMVQAEVIVADETAKVLAKRGTHAEMNEQRKPGCSDEDYALAVQVRELRASGLAWWAIGYKLGLKGSGPSVKQGKTGAAHARRLWEKAWGPTYKDTSVQRDTKARKVERALTQPGKPYFTGDAPDVEVLDAVRGKSIEWTTRLGAGDTVVCSIQTAIVGPRPEIVLGPKGRVLKFYELPEEGSRISGSLRSVYVDRIEKVGL